MPCITGAYSRVSSNDGEIVITHSQLIDNNQLFTPDANHILKISYSNIYNNYNDNYCYQHNGGMDCGAAINNFGDTIYDLSNNYWGHASGPTYILVDDDWDKPFLGTYIFGPAEYLPFLTSPWVPEPPVLERNPVIIVPGFFGSWAVGGGKLELDPITHVYDNLWEALKNVGYEQDKSLFAFPYNWRQSNATSSLLLKEKISEVKEICENTGLENYNCNKVDLVGHSMGGIVSRAYIESDYCEDDVDQLIFLATPHQGSPKSYLAWGGWRIRA